MGSHMAKEGVTLLPAYCEQGVLHWEPKTRTQKVSPDKALGGGELGCFYDGSHLWETAT